MGQHSLGDVKNPVTDTGEITLVQKYKHAPTHKVSWSEQLVADIRSIFWLQYLWLNLKTRSFSFVVGLMLFLGSDREGK